MFFNYMYSVINEKKSSPVSSFTTLIFFLTAVGHVTLVHLLPFPECQRGLFRCDRKGGGTPRKKKKLVLTSVKHLSLEHVQTKLQGVCKVIMVAGDVL